MLFRSNPWMMRAKGIFILEDWAHDIVYGPEQRAGIAQLVDVAAPPQTREQVAADPGLVGDVNFIFSAWGAPKCDRAFLESAPKLQAVFYASGTVKTFVTDEFWERGIRLSGATVPFSLPVAEYTISQILFCLKHGWHFALETRRLRTFAKTHPVPGAYGSTVGLISLGVIARRVVELLRPYDLKIMAFDPFFPKEEAAELGITLGSLEEVFAKSDVVSLHAPHLPETEGMIRREHFTSMKPGASFINTARAAVIDEPGMVEALKSRPDLFAVLDVMKPEPPEPTNPLFDLPNVIITPHIAGCMSLECRRGGQFVVEELGRFLRGEPLLGEITRERLAFIA
jgi:phosphoglycerate dehydrogenase-like enzyme